jgi:hypothetical protein
MLVRRIFTHTEEATRASVEEKLQPVESDS